MRTTPRYRSFSAGRPRVGLLFRPRRRRVAGGHNDICAAERRQDLVPCQAVILDIGFYPALSIGTLNIRHA